MKHQGNIWKKGLAACLMAVMLIGLMPLAAKAGTMYDAAPITLAQQIYGTIAYGEKEHWYSFTTGAEDGYYYVQAKNLSMSKSCTVSIRDSFSKSISYVSISAGNEKETTKKLLEANTTYYVKVNGSPSKTSDVTYEFYLFVLQDDAGNVPEKAKAVNGEVPMSGSHELKGDVDYYTFTTGIAGNYTISAYNNSSKSKSFAIYDEFNKSVGSISVPAYGEKKLDTKMFEANSVYYIKVYGGDEGDYSFRVLAPSDDCGNTAETAETMTIGACAPGYINYKKDVDYWKFTTGAETSYRITAINEGPKSVSIKLLDEGEAKESFPYSSLAAGKEKASSVTLSPNSTYYIVVQGSTPDTSYGVMVETIEDDYPDDWKDAKEIDPDNGCEGTIANKGDSDWVKFTPEKAAKYVFKSKGSGVKFEVYSLNGKGQLSKLGSGTSKTLKLNKKQTYYVRLYSSNKWTSYDYSFRITQK